MTAMTTMITTAIAIITTTMAMTSMTMTITAAAAGTDDGTDDDTGTGTAVEAPSSPYTGQRLRLPYMPGVGKHNYKED